MIEAIGISKSYGSFEAARDVTFRVEQGRIMGFLGPNGAGKTTVMKILAGYHFPTRGSALIEGYSVTENPREAKSRVGYLPENPPVYGELTVGEYLDFIAQARLIPGDKKREAMEKALEACALAQVRDKRIETLSKGYKQRTGLAQAIIHDPPILILDEPSSGLDPNQIVEIRSLIRELGERKTVILSTHILGEVEAVCNEALIFNEGKVVAQGKPDELGAALKGVDTYELTLKGLNIQAAFGRLSSEGGQGVTGLELEALGEGLTRAVFSLAGEGAPEMIFDWAVSSGLKILMMNRRKLSLEDIFTKLTVEGAS